LDFNEQGIGFRMEGSRYMSWNSGFKVLFLILRVQGTGLEIEGSGHSVWNLGFRAGPHHDQLHVLDSGREHCRAVVGRHRVHKRDGEILLVINLVWIWVYGGTSTVISVIYYLWMVEWLGFRVQGLGFRV